MVHCVRSVLSSKFSKGGNHCEKVTSINSDTVHQVSFFLALMECRSFLSANARFVNIDFHTALLFYELLSKIDAYAITYAWFLHKINSQ